MKHVWGKWNGGQAWDCSRVSSSAPLLPHTPHVTPLNVISFEQKKPLTLDNGPKSCTLEQELVLWDRLRDALTLAFQSNGTGQSRMTSSFILCKIYVYSGYSNPASSRRVLPSGACLDLCPGFLSSRSQHSVKDSW